MFSSAGFVFLGFSMVVAAVIIMSVRIYQVKPDFIRKLLKYGIVVFFGMAFSVAALVIGFRIQDRHTKSYSKSFRSVSKIWGGQVSQQSPTFSFEKTVIQEYKNEKTGKMEKQKVHENENMGFHTQEVKVNIKKRIRKKGLLLFPGFAYGFNGKYIIKNMREKSKMVDFHFPLPDNAGNITDLDVFLNGEPYIGDTNLADGISWSGKLKPGEKHVFDIKYEAQGTGKFSYALGYNKIQIKNLDINIETDFEEYIIPDGSTAPTKKSESDLKNLLQWKANDLVTGQNIAVKLEIKGNYGKVVSKMFFYSPLAIFLFIGFLMLMSVAREFNLHPMNYLFILIGYFIFYLFGSYMISYMHIILAILISLLVSSGIMVYYSMLLKKEKIFLYSMIAGVGIFQWIFSIAFFFPAHTGFITTVSAIVSFIILMKATSSIDWENKW